MTDEDRICEVSGITLPPVGGSHYELTAQIHLNRAEVKALATYLAKVDAYLSARSCKGDAK